MRTLLASALALSAFTSASIAAPLVLNDAQMDTLTAGQISQSNTSEVNVTQSNTSNVSMTEDAPVDQSNTSEVNVTQSNTSNVSMTEDAPVDQSTLTIVSFTMSLTEPGQNTLTYTTTQTN